jgi:hypothetical protein
LSAAIGPALEAPVERAVSRRVRLKEQTLKIGPLSGRQNVSLCQHHTLKNTERDVVVDREDNNTIAGEHDQHWGVGERSFGKPF